MPASTLELPGDGPGRITNVEALRDQLAGADAVLVRLAGALRHYYGESFHAHAQLEVNVEVTLTIDEQGAVTDVAVGPEGTLDTHLRSALEQRLLAATFGKPHCGAQSLKFGLRFLPDGVPTSDR